MNELPRQKLCEIISKYGSSVCDDPRRCEGLLRDFCGEYKGEINVLIGALKERVPADLLTQQINVPHEVTLARLTKRLIDDLLLAEDAARWAVESWSLALGVISSTQEIRKTDKPSKTVQPQQKIIQLMKPEILERIPGRDGAPMVLIPEGEFQMGSNDGNDNEKPVHTVYLDAFYIDKYEVTNAQYKKFMDAIKYKEPLCWKDSKLNAPDQPVVGVSWDDAKAYADWAGKRLPTEAEWEKSARGGLVGKKYVWSDEWPPPKGAGNFADETAKKAGALSSIIAGYDDGYAYTAPVGNFNPNGYELYDMAGNVWEWCADWYSDNYYASSPKRNPLGPSSADTRRVLRGGSWYYAYPAYLRVAFRDGYLPDYGYNNWGFRCASLRISHPG